MSSAKEILLHVRDYDLAATLESGQVFRWQPVGGAWHGVVGKQIVRLTQTPAGIHAETAAPVENWDWLRRFLQTEIDYPAVLRTFPDDEPMRRAVAACRGLRLLRQEPWECLASFILSSTKQIVQIRQIVARLCERFGEPLPQLQSAGLRPGVVYPETRNPKSEGRKKSEARKPKQEMGAGNLPRFFSTAENSFRDSEFGLLSDFGDSDFGFRVPAAHAVEPGPNLGLARCPALPYAFPTPHQIAAVSEAELRACKMGFRAPSLLAAARQIADGSFDLERLRQLDYARARAELMKLRGVGGKIADCVLLFACGFDAAFPVDTWVERALQEWYFPRRRANEKRLQKFAATHFGPHAGHAQQYLFHYMRTRNDQRGS